MKRSCVIKLFIKLEYMYNFMLFFFENLWLKTEHCWLVFFIDDSPGKNKANRFSLDRLRSLLPS